MSGYALTALAKADIFAIWSYIADDNEDAANRVEQGIYGACGAAQAPTGKPGTREVSQGRRNSSQSRHCSLHYTIPSNSTELGAEARRR